MKWHRGSLNHPKGKQEDGGRNDKVNMPRVAQAALFAYTKTLFWVYARASLRPRIPTFPLPSSMIHIADPAAIKVRPPSVYLFGFL